MDIIDMLTDQTEYERQNNMFSPFGSGLIGLRDVVLAAIGLLFLLPLFGFIAVLIKRDSEGPVFYRGKRMARGGGTFKILKFRTMYEDEKSYQGPSITGNGDTRITPVGKWLRDTKLNELPQLWNVLFGDMSLVGPRPEDPNIAAEWPVDIREEILSVRPGITSPASVLYRDEESVLSHDKVMDQYFNLIQPSKMRLDQLYVRHRSFWLDLDVFLWTFIVLLPRLGNFKPPENLLFFGPLAKLGLRYANWFVIDFVVSFLAFGISGIFWRTFGPIHLGAFLAIFISLAFSLLFSLIGALVGIQKTVWSKASASEIFDLALATGLATGLALLINHNQIIPFQIILLAAMIALTGFVLVRYRRRIVRAITHRLIRTSRSVNKFRERVLIVGGGKAGEFAAWMIHNGPNSSKYQVVGFVDDDFLKQDARMRGIGVLGKCDKIPGLVAEKDVGLILFAIHNINPLEREKILKLCYQTQAQVVEVPDVLGTIEEAVGNNGNSSETQDMSAVECEGKAYLDLEQDYLANWLEGLQKNIEQGDISGSLEKIEQLKVEIGVLTESDSSEHGPE